MIAYGLPGPPRQPCCSRDRLSDGQDNNAAVLGRAVDRARSLSLAGGFLPRPVPDRAQDQPIAHGDRPTALHAGIRACRRLEWPRPGRLYAVVRELRFARYGLALPRLLSEESGNCRRIDAAAAADRLSDRLRHGARSPPLAAGGVRIGGTAVLDIVPDPHLCVDQHSPT